MKTSTIAPSTKLRRRTEHYLNGKPVYIERDRCDGTVLISNSKLLRPEDNYWTVNKADLTSAPKFNLSKPTPKKPLSEDKQQKADMNSFFDSLGDKVTYNCMNCRKPLYAFTKPAKRASSAHILPKSLFPTVAKNPDNIVFMGVLVFGASCDCHSVHDSSVERRVKMPIYDLTLKRFELLKPHLEEAEIIRAEEYLGIRSKSLNLLRDIQEGKEVVNAK